MSSLLRRFLPTTQRLAVDATLIGGAALVAFLAGPPLATATIAAVAGGTLKDLVAKLFGAGIEAVGGQLATGAVRQVARRLAAPGDVLRNEDLTRLVGRAIESVLDAAATEIAALDGARAKRYRAVGRAAATRWAAIASSPAVVGLAPLDLDAIDERELHALLRTDPARPPTVLSVDAWRALLLDFAQAAAATPLDERDLATLAVRLQTTIARSIYEHLKEDFGHGGRAFAGLLLHLVGAIGRDVTAVGQGVADVGQRLEALGGWLLADAQANGRRYFQTVLRLQTLQDGVDRLHERDATLRDAVAALPAQFATEVRRLLGDAPALRDAVAHAITQDSKPALPRIQVHLSTRRPQRGDRHAARFAARNARIPFVGRTQELTALLDWLEPTPPDTVSIRVVTGPAGTGKSRLGMELSARAREVGWHAGFLDVGALTELLDQPTLAAWAWELPTLLVVDYAADVAPKLRDLFQRLAEREDLEARPPLRVLLLERYGRGQAAWWERTVGSRVGALGAWYAANAEDVELRGFTAGDDQARLLEVSLEATLGRAPDGEEIAHVRAMLAALARSGTLDAPPTPLLVQLVCELSPEFPADRRLDREGVLAAWRQRELWRRLEPLLAAHGASAQVRTFEVVIALVTLAQQGVRDAGLGTLGATVARVLPASPPSLDVLLVVLADVLGRGPDGFHPLQPDLLGEFWVREALAALQPPQCDALVDAVVALPSADPASFLVRAVLDFPSTPSLHAAVQRLAASNALPLGALARALEEVVALNGDRATARPNAFRPDLAMSLNDLSIACTTSGSVRRPLLPSSIPSRSTATSPPPGPTPSDPTSR